MKVEEGADTIIAESDDDDDVLFLESPGGGIYSTTSFQKVSNEIPAYISVFTRLGSALGKEKEIAVFLNKCKRRKFRAPHPDTDVFEDLDRKYVGALNRGFMMVLEWIAIELLPRDPHRLMAELKISSEDLRKTELSILKPARRLTRELKETIRNQPHFSEFRLAYESLAATLGNDYFSAVLGDEESPSSGATDHGSNKSTTSDQSSSSETDVHDEKTSDSDRRRSRSTIKISLFDGKRESSQNRKHRRRHKKRLTTANRNRAILKAGGRLERHRRFKFVSKTLEKAVDYILSHTKGRGVSKTRISLSKPHGSFNIPWLHRTMPRDALIDGELA